MDVTAQHLSDLVAAYGERGTARRLGKQQRQVWGWLHGEHQVRRGNQAAIEQAWLQLKSDSAGSQAKPLTVRHLRLLPGRKPADAMLAEPLEDEHALPGDGVFVFLDDYGARHRTGALARPRPKR